MVKKKEIWDKPERLCRECGKKLLGRVDQRFCNDFCRNTYNRHEKQRLAAETADYTEVTIIAILKNNHLLLRSFNKHQAVTFLIDKEKLYKAGFNFNFCTGCYQESDGRLRYYCFEQTWQELPYGRLELGVDRQKLGLTSSGRGVQL
ncbi:hypothetical protein [Mucilaginibacter paludis]|uniref:DUF2116 family Zn-ribbon domain-containing protein n=1 Tax=Mucilaginibacter paludis DSM 18603 TaxID=714943 RepID=H1Y147_9SPHI|nr:hypothetical protein [Mucilaginibacter paludis]EHQ29682.1 hypothetical protein Mucpa_5613 [Mucilaginibacter paludis DSM 18603]